MSWREDKPASSDIPNGDLADLMKSQKTHFSAYFGKHFFWADSSYVSAGIPRLSDGSSGPGSAHVFYGTASQVSHAGAGGKLMLTSDTSRFYGLHSAQSTFLGSKSAVVYSGNTSLATVAQGSMWLVQSSFTTANVGSGTGTNFKIVFPTAYAVAPPIIELTPIGSASTQCVCSRLSGTVLTSGFSANVEVLTTGTAGFYWRSVGTVSL